MNRIGTTICAAAVLALGGCYSDYHLQCYDVCETYDDCATVSFDSSACVDRCEEQADLSVAFSDDVLICDNCLDRSVDETETCSAGTECDDECGGIIPPFSQI